MTPRRGAGGRGELLVARHLRIHPVQLPEVDPLDAELLAAALGLGDQVVGVALLVPDVRAAAGQPPLVAMTRPSIGVERLADQLLRTSGP